MLGLSPPRLRTYSVPSLPPIQRIEDDVRAPVAVAVPQPQVRIVYHDGEKFPGGWGATDLVVPDYWTLRQRSADLFRRNLYARGLIRTLITNELNTGLHLEASPEEGILGYPEDGLAEWSEDVENRFVIWGKDPGNCDFKHAESFGALQATARREALVVGDVLVVLRQDTVLRTPKVQLINGVLVRTPMQRPREGVEIIHGVEVDAHRRHIAYWVQQPDGTSKRLPAWGEKTGRRLAWLLYGTDKRMDDIRGEPLLSLVLQSVKEIDRYRDSVQRKALVNSYIAGFIAKTEPGISTLPVSRAAVARGDKLATDTTGEPRSFKAAEHIPGLFIEELGHGEEPKAFPSHGTDEKFADFEQAILTPFAWSMQIPPEVLIKSFRNNYSASQAAINEFKAYLNSARTTFGENFCEPIYQEWLVAEVLAERIEAPKLLEAWRDRKRFVELGAWVSSDWSGNIKPAVDLSKLVEGYTKLLDRGLITHDRASRELTGTKFSKNVKKLARENEMLAAALKPMAELEASKKPAPPPPPGQGKEPTDAEPVDREDPEDEEDASARARPRAVA